MNRMRSARWKRRSPARLPASRCRRSWKKRTRPASWKRWKNCRASPRRAIKASSAQSRRCNWSAITRYAARSSWWMILRRKSCAPDNGGAMQAQPDDVITPQQAGTLHGLFLERARRSPDKIAYRHFQQNAWRNFTWREMLVEVARWQAALAGLGLQRGDRVAIMLRNCPCWVMFDQAAMSLGLVVVPLYTVDRPGNIAYIVKDADIKVLLFETAEQWH